MLSASELSNQEKGKSSGKGDWTDEQYSDQWNDGTQEEESLAAKGGKRRRKKSKGKGKRPTGQKTVRPPTRLLKPRQGPPLRYRVSGQKQTSPEERVPVRAMFGWP